ncbi:hypothetical protein CYLTODRAFT_459371 [Cylindrobasidium torrendii FP15055 ss-10]|uniref:Ubiquitin-like protease family profile domain-containing protein n=1 Tax=Cylindrobasidium torrendii FP15055 ss-10 TaxID=1314674 RepID=A0A0D7AVX1_9AGAR|nr:hypothetical protein CYLTODRAFT_459371 [Cylindrobasidium torrendii FP15055 ss-10]
MHCPKLLYDESLKTEVRLCDGREILFEDLKCVINGQEKLCGTFINAYCRALHQKASANHQMSSSWCIFSSLLASQVRGDIPQDLCYQMDLNHWIQSAAGPNLECLLTYTRWLFPLSPDTPYHWVLGWIDWSNKSIVIFDSIPHAASHVWAEETMLDAIEVILDRLGRPIPEWTKQDEWESTVRHPRMGQQQTDNWSCGLFVLMAVESIAMGTDVVGAEDGEKHGMHQRALELVLALPIRARCRPQTEVDIAMDTGVEGSIETVIDTDTESDVDCDPGQSLPTSPLSRPMHHRRRCWGMKENIIPRQAPTRNGSFDESRRKRKLPLESESPNQKTRTRSCLPMPLPDAAVRPANFALPVDGNQRKREPRRSEGERRQLLEADVWAGAVEPTRVYCNGCMRWGSLMKETAKNYVPYAPANWKTHKRHCAGQTGTQTKRKLVSTSIEAESGVPGACGAKKVARKYSRWLQQHPLPIPVRPAALSSEIVAERMSQPCVHFDGSEYQPYIDLTPTRNLGGVPHRLEAQAARLLFLWKKLPPLKSHCIDKRLEGLGSQSSILPSWGNESLAIALWTQKEIDRLDQVLRLFRRWEVNYHGRYVKSSECEGITTNSNGIRTHCQRLAQDQSFRTAVYRKKVEACLPEDELCTRLKARTRYTSNFTMQAFDKTKAMQVLNDDMLWSIKHSLEKDDTVRCSLSLASHARNGDLKNNDTLTAVASVFNNRLDRELSGNKHAAKGIRYGKSGPAYLNFCLLMRSNGGSSRKQYEHYTSLMGGPSIRHLRSLVSSSSDALQNPMLVWENFGRVRRYMDSVGYSGPMTVGIDCTKVKERLNYSPLFGGHILGSTLPLSACLVQDVEDIDIVVQRVKDEDLGAKQARAVLLQAPIPGLEPIDVALIPVDGKDTAITIAQVHEQTLKFAADHNITVVVLAADGAAAELGAQQQHDERSDAIDHFVYNNEKHGICLRVPIVEGHGPVVSVQDASHARKTGRNQPQHGTHTASLGTGHLVNDSIVQLWETNEAGIVAGDVFNVDKQDCSAGRRIFGPDCIAALTETKDGKVVIRKEKGIFAYIWFLGLLWDAWLKVYMSPQDRVACALRTQFWLHYWQKHIEFLATKFPDLYSLERSFISPASFNIFNRLCDTLVSLTLIFAEYYPEIPFCPWKLGTDFVEHALISHVLNSMPLLHNLIAKPLRCMFPVVLVSIGTSASCTKVRQLQRSEDTDSDSEDDDWDVDEHIKESTDGERAVEDGSLNDESATTARAVALALEETARLVALAEDCEAFGNHGQSEGVANHQDVLGDREKEYVQSGLGNSTSSNALPTGLFEDNSDRISIAKMVTLRTALQSGTFVHSEHSRKWCRLGTRSASHRVRVAQDLLQEPSQRRKKFREQRWQTTAKKVTEVAATDSLPNINTKNVTELFPLEIGSYVIVGTQKRFYIGEVLDMYRKGNSGRYDSLRTTNSLSNLKYLSLRVYLPLSMDHGRESEDEDEDCDPSSAYPQFSYQYKKVYGYLHTHAYATNILYHLGQHGPWGACPENMHLSSDAQKPWISLTGSKNACT